MAKWLKYQIVCNAEKNILLDKKIEYTEANIVIAQNEAYEGVFTIEEDDKVLEKEPLSVELGGTGAKVGTEACKNIGAVQVPTGTDLTEGFIYQNPDGTTKFVPQKLFKYSVIVDNGTDGTPSAVEYADDCVGFTPMTNIFDGATYYLDEGSWVDNALLEYFKPCVIAPEDNSPKYYLDKTNMSLKTDGTAAVLTGADGDVMVEVDGVLYGKFEHISSNKLKISIMNYSERGCFCFNDFGGVIKPRFYRGRYKAGVTAEDANALRSISGVAPLVSKTRAAFRTLATARGDDYHQNNIYMLFLWQAMFLLLFKDRNSQSALGNGRTGADSAMNCGWSDNYGWIRGTTASTDGVVFLGVEDFYGNVWEWVDGIVLNALTYKLTRNPSLYNDTGSDYEISAASDLSNANDNGKYLVSVKGTNDLGFLPASTGGSSATYYCDYFWVNDSVQVALFGGAWADGAGAGAFYWNLANSGSYAVAFIGSRLCRK